MITIELLILEGEPRYEISGPPLPRLQDILWILGLGNKVVTRNQIPVTRKEKRMNPFKQHTGVIALLDSSNVDTDQIIPKQFLKSIHRTGFGEYLFYDWRYLPNGKPNPEFSLNHPAFQGASILVTRSNFGCGSSREHAVWALKQYGIEVLVAAVNNQSSQRMPAFADIFKNNCVKNSVLTIELTESEVSEIFERVQNQKGMKAKVDLENQKLTLGSKPEKIYSFPVDPSAKKRLMLGLDDIGLSLQHEDAIRTFEETHSRQFLG